MWTQLAMAGLNAYQNEKNRMNDIASNAITSKYSAWTGQQPSWASQGKQSGMKTMTQGLMSGMLQNQEDERARKDEELRNKLLKGLDKPQESVSPRINRAPAVEPAVASSPVSVASPISPQMPSQGPIAPMSNIPFPVVGAPQIPFAPTPEEDLLKAQNPWLAMAQNYVAPPSESINRAPAVEASPSVYDRVKAANNERVANLWKAILPTKSPLYQSIWGDD